ncbi:MAG: hypothetical protein ACREFQ_17285, partial [Stellaceae bacterium]
MTAEAEQISGKTLRHGAEIRKQAPVANPLACVARSADHRYPTEEPHETRDLAHRPTRRRTRRRIARFDPY